MASTRVCSIEGCGKAVSSREFCNKHWKRFKKYGDPLVTARTPDGDPLRWLEEHCGIADCGCLIWPFCKSSYGYGMLRFRGRKTPASRVMCVMAHGEPPTLEHHAAHDCGNGDRGCVHPVHLR